MRFLGLMVLVAIGVNTCDCKRANESGTLGRLARGHDAAVGQFPYVVRLKARYRTNSMDRVCTGALIGCTWVLTAAHCVADMTIVKVYLGSIVKGTFTVAYCVAPYDITVHPNFQRRILRNDIALIKIPSTDLSDRIAIVPLPRNSELLHKYENAYALGCGWGRTSAVETMSTKLQCGRLKILSKKDCPSNHKMCTAMSANFATPCIGDSGGPLVLETTGKLVGIASTGDKKCVRGKPAKYTRVNDYLIWITLVSGISY